MRSTFRIVFSEIENGDLEESAERQKAENLFDARVRAQKLGVQITRFNIADPDQEYHLWVGEKKWWGHDDSEEEGEATASP